MKKRRLGHSDLEIAPLAFGGNVFGWTADEKTSFELLDAFVDTGFNLIDTANMYSTWVPGHQGGESETIIGRWLTATGKRDQVLIATKVGMEMGDGSKGLRKDYILKSVEDSLRRLQTDHIDLYQSHADAPETPIEETLSAFDTLVSQGKVRVIGASNFSPERLEQSLNTSAELGTPSYASLQPEYNLYDRADFEAIMERVCLERRVGVITYYSLASGFLSGKYRSEADFGKSQRGGGIAKYLTPRGFRILEALDEVAAAQRVTPAVVALAWLQQRPAVTAPIVSATSVSQWNELAASAHLQLDESEIARLNQASAPAED